MAPKSITLAVPYLFQKEAPLATGQDITPGMLCEITATGTIQPCSVDGATVKPETVLVAVETPFRPDSGVSSGIDSPYDQDAETVAYLVAHAGDQLYMLLAAGQDVNALSDRLGSNEDGTLKVATTGAFCRPLELVDNDPGSGGLAVRIRVEVL